MKTPTDIVALFKTKIEQWNEAKQCDHCWEFSAPLTIPALNTYQNRSDEECCVHVFVTNLRGNDPNYRPSISYEADYARQYATVYFLLQDRIDTNNYNEMDGHPIEESKYSAIIRPLFECIFGIDFCEIDDSILIENINWQIKINWQDSNYTGWQFDFTFRELLQ